MDYINSQPHLNTKVSLQFVFLISTWYRYSGRIVAAFRSDSDRSCTRKTAALLWGDSVAAQCRASRDTPRDTWHDTWYDTPRDTWCDVLRLQLLRWVGGCWANTLITWESTEWASYRPCLATSSPTVTGTVLTNTDKYWQLCLISTGYIAL